MNVRWVNGCSAYGEVNHWEGSVIHGCETRLGLDNAEVADRVISPEVWIIIFLKKIFLNLFYELIL